ncbi:MAG: hypothetical protein KDD28_33350, partial [Phaeodactylibacter sp.]|nr:hypothetical protein [Phaeodactylibacter sp.]
GRLFGFRDDKDQSHYKQLSFQSTQKSSNIRTPKGQKAQCSLKSVDGCFSVSCVTAGEAEKQPSMLKFANQKP